MVRLRNPCVSPLPSPFSFLPQIPVISLYGFTAKSPLNNLSAVHTFWVDPRNVPLVAPSKANRGGPFITGGGHARAFSIPPTLTITYETRAEGSAPGMVDKYEETRGQSDQIYKNVKIRRRISTTHSTPGTRAALGVLGTDWRSG